jgi:ssDNA-binding Zn-finger/Zn-ribbon topoisomerase 1
MQIHDIIGDCPECGDELIVYRTRSGKRVAKCLNNQCPKQYAYPLPTKGTIETTGSICPETSAPLLAIIPNIVLKNRQRRRDEKKTYFWAKGPCFACSKAKKCEPLKEALSDYIDEENDDE